LKIHGTFQCNVRIPFFTILKIAVHPAHSFHPIVTIDLTIAKIDMSFSIGIRFDISLLILPPLLQVSIVGSTGLLGLAPSALQDGLDPAEYFRLKGKFFSEDIMLLMRSPTFANILLSLNIFQQILRDSKMFSKIEDLTCNIISSEKNLPLKDSKETRNRKEDVDLVVRNLKRNAHP
jgi:hypothetical protein